jgi:hypothetical protein
MSADAVYEALDALSQAHGPRALVEAHRRLQRSVKRTRQASGTERQMADAIMAAVDVRQRLKADGATGGELENGLALVVKESWPKHRPEPWRYLCATCLDSGLELRICHDGQACGLANGKPHEHPHEYGVPCFCSLGRRFKTRERSPEDAVSAAAKVSKPTRFGGR